MRHTESVWFLYVIETEKGRLYTGVARDVNARFRQHLGEVKGGAKFFYSDKPCLLVYCKECADRSSAQKLESQIKSLSRKEKEWLVYAI